LTLYYFGGQYAIPIHLGPLESYNLDMRSLVNSRIPDPSGALIPSNLTGESGSAVLSGAGGETETISVAVSASVFNVRNATCVFFCTTCNGFTQFGLSPGSYIMNVLGSAQAQAQATFNTGSVYTNPSGTTWSIAESSIATVGANTGVLTGQSAGQTGASAVFWNAPVYFVNCGSSEPCPENEPWSGRAGKCVFRLNHDCRHRG
jgi:hypothetical protein